MPFSKSGSEITAAVFPRAAKSVLLLRPRALSEKTAAALRALGFAPYILPLSRAAALPFSLPAARFTALLATSANAFARLNIQENNLPDYLKALPLYCAGGRTAAAAKARGFTHCAYIAENAETLIAALKAAPPARWLYLAGRPRRSVIEDYCRAAHIPCHAAEVYEIQPLAAAPADLSALPETLSYILLYSAQNAAALPPLAAHIGYETRLLCLSERIAASVPPQWRSLARIAAAPNERELLRLLPEI